MRYGEVGRSMVEVLGTLAIMGIIAVTGIWAYGMAMDHMRASTLINESQKRAVSVAGQIGFQGRANPTLSEFSENTFGGGTFSQNVIVNGLYGQFGILVSGVSKRVCQNILNLIGTETTVRRLAQTDTPRETLSSCDDENTFLMIYNDDLSVTDKTTEETTTTCSHDSDCLTACGLCAIEEGMNDGVCINECPITPYRCSQNSDCTGECVGCNLITHTCQACQPVEYLEATGSQRIDTGISGECRWIGSAQSTSKQTTSQCLISSSQDTGRFLASQIKTTYFWGVSSAQASAYSSTSVTQKANFDVTFLNNSTTGTVNGQSISMTPVSTLQTWRMFECSGNPATTYPFYGKIFYLKAYQGSSLVRDFVPVHAPFKTDGKQNCLFDRVSRELFCNADDGVDFVIP